MKLGNIKLLMVAATILLAFAFTVYKSISWKVKEDYAVMVFQGGDHFISFKDLKAVILFDEENPEKSKISATIDANPIVKNNEALRKGAIGPEALDLEKYPVITFESTSVTKIGSAYEAIGNLTIKGITKEIKMPFTFANEIFKGGFTIVPKDFNITSAAFTKDLNVVLDIPVTK